MHSNCRQDQWQCDNLQCISKDSLCDGYKQCSDGSDELKRECEKTGKVAIKSQENIEEIWFDDGNRFLSKNEKFLSNKLSDLDL